MANGPALSTAKGGEIYVGSEFIDSFSKLDVVYGNQFEGEITDPEVVEETEKSFYRGSPPDWLNFHVSEQVVAGGTGTPFIKRDGYDTLVKQIRQRRKVFGISTAKLFHQPGCGGTTLAMQVLWDLRKTFRSAVLTGSTSDITSVAEEVVYLFTAGGRGHQNIVLLLLNDEQILENLQDGIMKIVSEQKIVTHMPVVIFLSCVRTDVVLQNDHVVLQEELSETEKQLFNEKQKELSRKYRDEYKQFHGFNIMQTNFSEAYVKQACKVFSTVRRSNRPQKTQLAAFLSLLNTYVPGSYLLESQCLDFFKHDEYIHGDFSLEDRMKPFSDLIITFQHDIWSEKKVRMAHRMIAQCCTELMAEAGVTRSDTARNFLTRVCREEVPPSVLGFVKDMLTKREKKKEENSSKSTEMKEERFSRLILDVKKIEGNVQSASILKVASNQFDQNAFFPQALARFYYIEINDYNQAEMWAKRAKQRDPQSSFVADTLGQVYKNHLAKEKKPSKILQLATKAIRAFKDEERLAENEHGTDMKDGQTKVSRVFNTRGQFGYLQVCNLVYDLLVSQNETWKGVLTKNVPMCSVLKLLGDNKLLKYNFLINSLRDEVERKCAFFDKCLTYSKPDLKKDDAPYISKDTSDCYKKYVGDSPPKPVKQKCDTVILKLKQNRADTSAGVLSCLDRESTESELKEIITWWEEISHCKDSTTALANYIFAHIMLINMGSMFGPRESLTAFRQKMPLSPNDAPELHMLALLLFWPTDNENKPVYDPSELIQRMHRSYELTYKTDFGSRYLRPLFFIGIGHGLNRIVHRKVLERLFLEQNKETVEDWSNNWSNDTIFQPPMGRLLQVDGMVQNYRVFATIGGTAIEVDAHLKNSLWKNRNVSFYLGFNIRGPVAFRIRTRTAENSNTDQHFVDRNRKALIDSMKDTGGVLDELKGRGVISDETYDKVRAKKPTQEQMRDILTIVTSSGRGAKDALYEILKGMKNLRHLMSDLEGFR